MRLSYRFRLKPTKAQHGRLREALEQSRLLYNAALEERIGAYRATGKGRTYFDQTACLPEIRRDMGLDHYAWSMLAYPLKQLDQAFKAFFRRGGFPRFKGRDHYKTIGWGNSIGCRIRDGRLLAKGIGAIRIHMHRPVPSDAKFLRVKREGRHWYLFLSADVPVVVANDNPPVGIDMGILTLAALSTGELIPNPRVERRQHAALRRRSRAFARCKKGSARRRKVKALLVNAKRRQANARKTYLHQVSAGLTRRFGFIAIEKLNIEPLTRGMLARDVRDVAWGTFVAMLRYKSARDGAKLIEVNPRRTSQTCPDCGAIKAKALSERVHDCPCGCIMDRDVAAAKVVLHRAMHGPDAANVGGHAERSHGKAAATPFANAYRYAGGFTAARRREGSE